LAKINPAKITPSAFLTPCIAVVLVLAQGCGPAARSLPPACPNVVRIVSSLPARGLQAAQGKQIANAIDLAVGQRNPSLPTWVVEHLRLDSSGDESGSWTRQVEEANASGAAVDPSVIAYIGPYTSGATGFSLPVTNRAGLLEVGSSATWPGLTREGWDVGEPAKYYPTGVRTYARLMPSDAGQAVAAANWSVESGVGSVFVASDGSLYSDSLAREFAHQEAKLGKKVSEPQVIDPRNMNAAMTLIERSGADALYFAPGSTVNAIQVAKALKNVPLPGGVYSSDTALSDRFLEDAGGSATGWHIVFNGIPAIPVSTMADRFRSDFIKKYGEPPTPLAANAYDLTNLVIDAVGGGAGRDRDAVRRSVLSTRQYEGVSGKITFDERGEPVHWTMTGYVISGGQFRIVKLLHDVP
jgi:branched-chain amino acid transport system substrate-binding protein